MQLERPWRIKLFHHNFNELNPFRTSESFVLKELIELVLGVHRIRLRCLAFDPSKGLKELRPIPTLGHSDILENRERRGVPICNIVVLPFLAMQVPLNRIALVVWHEDDRLDSNPHHNR